jgi:hypothetical protein
VGVEGGVAIHTGADALRYIPRRRKRHTLSFTAKYFYERLTRTASTDSTVSLFGTTEIQSKGVMSN